MIEWILIQPIIPTPIWARLFIAMCCVYLVYDYRSDVIRSVELKRIKRANRQIFDEHGEVADMTFKAINTTQFARLDFLKQMEITRFINGGY